MSEARADAVGLLQFWRAVELLEPHGAPKLERPKDPDRSHTLQVEADESGPWERGQMPPPRKNMAWQFTVYGGLFRTDAVTAALVRALGVDDTVPSDGPRSDIAALYALTLDDRGRVLRGSPTLSACGWAVGRLRRGRLPDLDGFDDEQRGFAAALARLSAPGPQASTGVPRAVGRHLLDSARAAAGAGATATGVAVTAAAAAALIPVAGPIVGGIAGAVAGGFAEKLLTPPGATSPQPAPTGRITGMTPVALHRFTAELAAKLGVAEPLRPRGLRVRCTQVSAAHADEPVEQDMLNSFIAEDLSRIAEHVARGDVGPGLSRYLSRHVDTTERIDVAARRDVVLAAVDPSSTPSGRWPDDADKPLAMSQQFAVNEILGQMRHQGGILSVNGPPGTGKTTLLRDVMAAVVVDRAEALAGLASPDDAFGDIIETVTLNDKYPAKVRRVLPELTGFEMVVTTAGNRAAANVTAEIPGVDAVGRQADAARKIDYFVDIAERLIDGPAWGLMAATLGNSTLNRTFRERFWFQSQSRPTMMKVLRHAERNPDQVEPWDVAVARFRNAERRVQVLAAERAEVAGALRELPGLRERIRHAEARALAAREARPRLQEQIHYAAGAHRNASQALDDLNRRLRDHAAEKPNLWVSLSTRFRAGRHWEAERRRLRDEEANARAAGRAAHDHARWLTGELHAAAAADAGWSDAARTARNDATHAQRCVDEEVARRPGTVPAGSVVASEEALQLCAPWADPEFTEARSRLFLAAMALHRTFVLRAARTLRPALAVAVDATRSRKPAVAPDALIAAWQSLFLVIPVVSTTFASLPKLFTGIGREGLGWLFVDEAGQANTQQVVGGIWRAARTVVVGDPQQLEPIGTLPLAAQRALCRRHRIDEHWLPDHTSAQLVADRQSTLGTSFRDHADPTGEARVWVGAPLRVHRRCDRPMFEMSNDIAYDGSMVFGTPGRSTFPGRDCWLHVPPGRAEGNWLPAEGEALEQLLRHLKSFGPPAPNLAVLSPFRAVIAGVRSPVTRTFPDATVGTAHTMQGREADIVVLVLGGDPTSGARDWVTERPNLLNVAVSRARRRLYVIGDREDWQQRRYIDVLAARLPVGTPF